MDDEWHDAICVVGDCHPHENLRLGHVRGSTDCEAHALTMSVKPDRLATDSFVALR